MRTVNLAINRPIAEKIGAPRSVFVKFPHGASFGEPGHVDQQLTILRDLFWAAQDLETPGEILDPGYKWKRSDYEKVSLESFNREQSSVG